MVKIVLEGVSLRKPCTTASVVDVDVQPNHVKCLPTAYFSGFDETRSRLTPRYKSCPDCQTGILRSALNK